METDEIRKIAVVGAGLMGHGIALDFAMAGYEVHLQDLDQPTVQRALSKIRASLQMLGSVGLAPPDGMESTLERIHGTVLLKSAVSAADLVIESVFEDLALKQQVFKELDQLCPAHTILASNTSGFPPSRLAAATARPHKVVVAHYFNPPFLLPLVEVVKGEKTSAETVDLVCAVLRKAGKHPALVQKEAPGFIGNRLQAALIREAISIVDKGIAAPQDVDLVVRHGFGRRLAVAGVFEVFDIAGWDLALSVGAYLFPDLESSSEAPRWLKQKVERGEVGVKAGKGFYDWTPASAEARNREIAQGLIAIAQHQRPGFRP